MIDSAQRQFAQNNGLTISRGIAYGNLGGIAVTLYVDGGLLQMAFATQFSSPAGQTAVNSALSTRNLKTEFGIAKFTMDEKTILVSFQNKRNAAARMDGFLAWFLPLLHANGASGADVCAHCGQSAAPTKWAIYGGAARPFHPQCAQRVKRELEEARANRLHEPSGSYFTGLLGALLGAALGAVVWAVVLQMGYIAALVGLLIGFLAEKGYCLCKGKQGKGKLAVLVLAIVVGVLLGTFLSEAYEFYSLIQSGAVSLRYSDIPMAIYAFIVDYPDYRAAILKNVIMGLLFAALGVYSLLRRTGAELRGETFTELEP